MERSKHLTSLAAQAAARTVRRAQIVTERYTEQELSVTRAEAEKHMRDYGHMYDEDCQAEFCQKVRTMFANAQAAVGSTLPPSQPTQAGRPYSPMQQPLRTQIGG